MNNTKKYLSLFLILTTILNGISVFYISAAQAVDEFIAETENVVIEHELAPMMANRCVGGFNYNGDKTAEYAQKRGWDDAMIYAAIAACVRGSSINRANNNAACSVYCYPGTTYYVVIENNSRSLVQCSKYGDDAWIPDESIVWF